MSCEFIFAVFSFIPNVNFDKCYKEGLLFSSEEVTNQKMKDGSQIMMILMMIEYDREDQSCFYGHDFDEVDKGRFLWWSLSPAKAAMYQRRSALAKRQCRRLIVILENVTSSARARLRRLVHAYTKDTRSANKPFNYMVPPTATCRQGAGPLSDSPFRYCCSVILTFSPNATNDVLNIYHQRRQEVEGTVGLGNLKRSW